jgi:16S rRNA (cytidine1402-2'-O)-methyltransferase
VRVLGEVELIACEDTRRTRVLLNHFGIKAKTISYHEHNERQRAEQLCKLLEAGQSVALVSDAGTPLISDPGFRIVTAAIDRGISVVPVPGAAAFISALVASGLPSDQFFFAGFLPARAQARRGRLEELRAITATLVFYETPHRIAATLRDACDVFGERRAVVGRELTKLHEEIARGSLSELREQFSSENNARGEMVLIISGEPAADARTTVLSADSSDSLLARVRNLEKEGLESKEALKKAAREFGLKRAEAYRLLVAQKNRRSK